MRAKTNVKFTGIKEGQAKVSIIYLCASGTVGSTPFVLAVSCSVFGPIPILNWQKTCFNKEN